MRQKTIAVLNCGVELKDSMYGIDFISADRDFSVQIDRSEITDLIAYLQGYQRFYITGEVEGRAAEALSASAGVLSKTETPPTLPIAVAESRSAKMTVPLKTPEGLPPGSGTVDPRFRVVEMAGQDLGKDVKALSLTVQKRS